jgi:hypothetical protein
MNATLERDAPIAVRNVYEIPRDRSSWPGHFASGLRGPVWRGMADSRRDPPHRSTCSAGHRSGAADVNFHGVRTVSVLARKILAARGILDRRSDPAGVRVPHILLHVRAFLRLMTSDEAARRRADDAVMAGIVAGDTADDRAFQTTLG